MLNRAGRIVILTFVLVLVVSICQGQPCDANCGGDVDEAPLTGIEWLMGAGVILGLRNFFNKVRKKNG